MWRAIHSSVIGSSHLLSGQPCQDHSQYAHVRLGCEDALVIAISDGAGSAAKSDIGARVAVDHLIQIVANSGLRLHQMNKASASDWTQSAINRLEQLATETGTPIRDFACTLLFAVLGRTRSIFVQVGDGAWVAQTPSALEPLTWPSGGEYANQTTFITSPNWREALQFKTTVQPIEAVAGFTDGLQSVALNIAARTAHAPFFTAKFHALNTTHDFVGLTAALAAFLSSKQLLERTDDDKTLVLACWHAPKLLLNR